MDDEIRRALSGIPSVDEAVREAEERRPGQFPRWALLRAVREEIALLRSRALEGRAAAAEGLDAGRLERRVEALLAPSLRPVINATGVVVHTNLGRAPLGEDAIRRIVEICSGYSNLEYDLPRRARGSRHAHLAEILRQLTGAEDALVVNNNAAAVLLCLAALARGKEVVVSRGELIEIGGSFRLPDVMAASGAVLREVGTTNRTHARDYRAAVGPDTALLLRAHRSNFAVVGFTSDVDAAELAAIGRETGVPTLFDLGSGTLVDLEELGLPGEPTVRQAVRSGFDLVCFSGDKLLGGPQAGVVVGRAQLVQRLRGHPLMRALRPDKLCLAGLSATLEAYRDGGEGARERVPVLALLSASDEELRGRAARLRARLRRRVGAPWSFTLRRVTSRVGGGALPLAAPPSWAVCVEHPEIGADAVEKILRGGDPPVLARIEEDRLLLDLRAVPERGVVVLARSAAAALVGHGSSQAADD